VALAGSLGLLAFLVAGVGSGPLDWVELVTGAVWDPSRDRFGAAAMVFGSVSVSAIALAIAVPIGWGAAYAISELSGPARPVLRAATELLAAVPSVVYGLLGVTLVRGLVSSLFDVPGGDSLLAAGILLAIMILPTIVAVSVDALSTVPATMREAAAALGLTRMQVIASVLRPVARPGMRAAVLLGLARALGETIAIFLVVGRADGRMPSPDTLLGALVEPGQTLTSKLGGPEPLLAGSTGPHWAALCALALVLLALVGLATVLGTRRTGRLAGASVGPSRAVRRRLARDRWGVASLRALTVALLAVVAGLLVTLAVRGSRAFDVTFWLTPAAGAAGGGIRDQLAGTALLAVATALIAGPVALCVGTLLHRRGTSGAGRALRVTTVTVGATPSIVLGLAGYAAFSLALGWGKSWLAGAIVLAVLVVPVGAIATAARLDALPPGRREAALALGLTPPQFLRSVLLPHAWPGLATGLLLGLSRTVGETALLLFTATVFSGGATIPSGVVDAPVQTLPTHVFTLAQDALDPAAMDAAWGAATVLVLLAGALLLASVPLRRRLEAS
jgi:phosphate transport system permease protein